LEGDDATHLHGEMQFVPGLTVFFVGDSLCAQLFTLFRCHAFFAFKQAAPQKRALDLELKLMTVVGKTPITNPSCVELPGPAQE
jgi:hypothetical protein